MSADLSGPIPGVQLWYGGLSITATQPGHNTAVVSYANNNPSIIQVTFNGQTENFDTAVVGSIWTVNYAGDQHGQGGFDSFTNLTHLSDTVAMYGGNNTVVGSDSWNFVLVTDGTTRSTSAVGAAWSSPSRARTISSTYPALCRSTPTTTTRTTTRGFLRAVRRRPDRDGRIKSTADDRMQVFDVSALEPSRIDRPHIGAGRRLVGNNLNAMGGSAWRPPMAFWIDERHAACGRDRLEDVTHATR